MVYSFMAITKNGNNPYWCDMQGNGLPYRCDMFNSLTLPTSVYLPPKLPFQHGKPSDSNNSHLSQQCQELVIEW